MGIPGVARRPSLLYLTPVFPAQTGRGLTMRAGMVLDALAEDYDVSLLIIPVLGDPLAPDDRSWTRERCARILVHEVAPHEDTLVRLIARVKDPRERHAALLKYHRPLLCRFATTRSISEAAQLVGDTTFQEVHVFRLYLAPFAQPYLRAPAGSRPVCRLDVDDLESIATARLAALCEARGDPAAASLARAEAEKYAAMERQDLARFDRVYVCSEHDRRWLVTDHGHGNIAVLPNGVQIPAAGPRSPTPGSFTFLFVGNLNYYPNEDAVLFFCAEVLPRLRAMTARPFRLVVVGTLPSPRIQQLSALPEVTVIGPVADVADSYGDADAVVAPLRAGGGTRIKLLEAFAQRRPAVSTTIGTEGIDAQDGTHLLIADTAEAFAGQCARLMADPDLGARLAERAFEYVSTHHSPQRIRQLLREDHARG